jgi:hypothetical protein
LAVACDPVRGPCGSARWGPACGRDGTGPATADPGGQVVATLACGLWYTTQVSETNLPIKCSMEYPGEGRGGAGGPRRRRVPRRPWRLANTGNHKGSPGGLARNGVQDRGGIRRARPSPAWARRRRRGGGAGDLTRAGPWKRESDGVRGGVHARQVTTAGEQGWGPDGASRRCSRRSPTRRHGWRRARRPRLAQESACGFTAVAGRACGGQGQGAPFPPLLETEHGALGHGEAAAVLAGLGTAASPTREDRGQGST